MAQRTQKVIGSAGIYEVKSTGTIEVGWLYSSGMIPCNCLHQILKQSLEWLISSCNLTHVNSYTALQFHRISINLLELLILPASHLTSTRSLKWFVGSGGHPHLGPSSVGIMTFPIWWESHKTCSKTPTKDQIMSKDIPSTHGLLLLHSHCLQEGATKR